ncbi:acetoin reductase family protein, partial [Gymnopus androsaceus JB14]
MSQTNSRVALVTGAAQGIGRAISIRLASDGFKVALSDLPSKREQLDAEEQVKEMVESSSKALGGLDVMVSNAGIMGVYKPIIDMSLEEFEQVLRINLRGCFLCYKYGGKEIIATGRPGGRLIGSSSVVGKQASANASQYSASKFAVRGLTQSAALELGQYGITVNAYAPGTIRTAMSELLWNGTLDIKEVLPALPSFAKIGEPEDVASIVSYLASKESHYITGKSALYQSTIFHIDIVQRAN